MQSIEGGGARASIRTYETDRHTHTQTQAPIRLTSGGSTPNETDRQTDTHTHTEAPIQLTSGGLRPQLALAMDHPWD